MMRFSRLYLLLAFLTLLALLSSGCAMLGGKSQTGDAGLTDITVYAKERSTLEQALETLRSDEKKGLIDLTGVELTQVLGIRVDQSGSARTWTLGYRGGNITRVLEYTGGKWTGVDIQLPLPEEKIPLEQVILPTKLFTQQKTIIGEAFSRRGVNEAELILKGDTYLLTVPSPSGTSVLIFDARTGEVRPSP